MRLVISKVREAAWALFERSEFGQARFFCFVFVSNDKNEDARAVLNWSFSRNYKKLQGDFLVRLP